jgi:threonine dehydrogenase-like Zn-dependent dehydrogenase
MCANGCSFSSHCDNRDNPWMIRLPRLTKATGTMADVVVDVTARAPAAFAQAIALARPAGTVVVAGARGFGGGVPGFSPDQVVFEELRVIGALGVDVTAPTPHLIC